MHELKPTDDCIDRAGEETKLAADTSMFIDKRLLSWALDSVLRVQWCIGQARELAELSDSIITTRGALINVGLATSNRICIGPTGRIATSGALRLRQNRINSVG